jgi:hypothetical protein
VRKALKKEELAQILDYDPDFLDWYFSVQSEKELNAVIKQRKYVRKYYYEHKKNNTKTKTEHHQKKYYEKLKADPVKYYDYLKKKREYF